MSTRGLGTVRTNPMVPGVLRNLGGVKRRVKSDMDLCRLFMIVTKFLQKFFVRVYKFVYLCKSFLNNHK